MRYKITLHNFRQYSSLLLFKSNLPDCTKFTSRNMSLDTKVLEETKSILKELYFAGIKAVSPKSLILNKVKFDNGILKVCDQSFELTKNVYMIGFGKAVMGMAQVLEHMLGDYLKKGIISVPSGSMNAVWESEDKSYFPKLGSNVVEYYEGGINNQPDDRCFETTHKIVDLVEPLTEDDILIVLISGGGSALLYMPRPVIDHDDKLILCKQLQNAGANITELNIVRRKLSMVKGGGLGRMAYPATVISLILSDIVGDPIDLIASGPTVYDPKVPKEVIEVLKKYNLFDSLEGDLKKVLMANERFKDAPLLVRVKRERFFKHVINIILGNNMVAVEAASSKAYQKQLTPIILRSDVTGNVHDVSLAYTHITSLLCLALDKTLTREEFFEKVKDIPIMSLPANKVDEIYNLIENISGEGIVLIGGGEPVVVVEGKGKGGRNQELALHFSLDWLAKIKSNPHLAEYDVIMLSAGTDGQDGPTDAAGAFGYPAIGPQIHDLYAKMKFLASENLVNTVTAKEDITKRLEDKRKFLEVKPEEIYNKYELSEFVKIENVDAQNEKQSIEAARKELLSKLGEDHYIEGINPFVLQQMEVERILPENALKENDTYNLYSRFKKGSDLFKTGLTGTNVMDLHFIHIKKRRCGCKPDGIGKEMFENVSDTHDLHIDPSTIEKYKAMWQQASFEWDKAYKLPLHIRDKTDEINIKIIDDNLKAPCCRKDRKFPPKNILKGKKLPL